MVYKVRLRVKQTVSEEGVVNPESCLLNYIWFPS